MASSRFGNQLVGDHRLPQLRCVGKTRKKVGRLDERTSRQLIGLAVPSLLSLGPSYWFKDFIHLQHLSAYLQSIREGQAWSQAFAITFLRRCLGFTWQRQRIFDFTLHLLVGQTLDALNKDSLVSPKKKAIKECQQTHMQTALDANLAG